jgi:hypothetical protein
MSKSSFCEKTSIKNTTCLEINAESKVGKIVESHLFGILEVVSGLVADYNVERL